ncbi:MAG: hypothetical protein D6732_15450 [Methanobacteriota archaeon]|nr:MAG: hypothetical protein D6732_15450 [Euryarchaeota archaeon]
MNSGEYQKSKFLKMIPIYVVLFAAFFHPYLLIVLYGIVILFFIFRFEKVKASFQNADRKKVILIFAEIGILIVIFAVIASQSDIIISS